jgi:catechol 2,3-dioxygenase-like lactoylglutathione lyase family enzyme
MLRGLFLLLSVGLVASSASAQLPDYFREVAEVHWIVADLEAVLQAWNKFGFPPDTRFDERIYTVNLHSGPTTSRERVARGHIGGVSVVWIQPVEGKNAHSEFLEEHRSGIFSLMHRVPTIEELDREVARLHALGIPVLQRGTLETGKGPETYVYFDTAKEGKYILGLIHTPVLNSPPEKEGMKTRQYAFVVKDMRPVSAFWTKLGFPPLSYTHPALSNLRYHRQPGTFDQELGWQRHGKVEYEWIVPLRGPTVYQDYLNSHGEGLHHLAFEVPNLDSAIARWASFAVDCVQSGSWGEEKKPGWGRYAYVDTEPIGGVTLELLWNFRQ